MALVKEKYREWLALEFESGMNAVDVKAGTSTYASQSGVAATKQFDFIIGGDGAGSVVRKAMLEHVAGFTVETKSFPNHCAMIESETRWTRTIFMDCPFAHSASRARFRETVNLTHPAGSAPSARRQSRSSVQRKRRAGSSASAFLASSN